MGTVLNIPPVKIGMLSPGGMGAAVGKVLKDAGHEVFVATDGRSDETKERGQAFEDVGTIKQLVDQVDVIICICGGMGVFAVYGIDTENEVVEFPVAQEVVEAGFKGIYVDCNTIISDPAQARWEVALADYVNSNGASYVSASLYGYPDRDGRVMFVSGDSAEDVVAILPREGEIVGGTRHPRSDTLGALHIETVEGDAKGHKRYMIEENVPSNPENYSRTDDKWVEENG